MGRKAREKPRRLAEKLLRIRNRIDGGLSQEEMVKRLGLASEFDRTYISKWEGAVIEPPLRVLLRYAQVAGVILDILADDNLDLPRKLPNNQRSECLKG
ncbi:MAG TPA: helix-turn-helix transcriptional regulator [Pyrinomonadaceae bacterium]|jgi:transcriptional regulator with XRE-family HTH domain|nr:helix-turn-helix transcriptional regulator [Pyrinomonadaceae bacterium]